MTHGKPGVDGGIAAWVDRLQAAGRYTFAREDLVGLAGRSPVAIDAALRRLKKSGRIQSPRRGFLVVVPVEYRTAGCPPPSWFVGDLMRFLDQPYYVGILSAAALHGASHQQPMNFQVVTDRPTRTARAGRTRIEFHQSGSLEVTPTVDLQTETGTMRVATPEATAFDLVRYPSAAGYLDNVVTVLAELVERMQPEALATCGRSQPVPDAQRVGYLLEQLGQHALGESLFRALEGQRLRTIPLAPKRARGRRRADPRWRVIPNWKFEADL
ncbi:MAG: type IV toxin-antitoxin system AbiEi family antitoxin [Planctomycetota bacterium]